MAAKRMTILLKDKDLQAVKTLQARFGLLSRSDAIRFALRVLALPPGRQGALQDRGFQGLPSVREPVSLRELQELLTASTALPGTVEQGPATVQATRPANRQNSQQLKA